MAKFTNTTTGTATRVYNAAVMSGWPDRADLVDDANVSVVGGTRAGETRQATSFTSSGGSPGITTVAFSGNVDATSECEVWRFGLDADLVNEAIDVALTEVGPDSVVQVQNITLATEKNRINYPLPASNFDALYRVELFNKSPISGLDADTRTTGRGLWDTSDNEGLARKITLSAGEDIWGYLLHLSVVGAPNVTLTAQLFTDSAGLPGSVVAGSAVTMASTLVSGPPRYYVFRLAAPFHVTMTGTYWLVLSHSGSVDGTNYVTWSEQGDSPETTAMARYNGSVWSTVSGSDLVHQIIPDNKGSWYEWAPWMWRVRRGPSPAELEFVDHKNLDTDLGAAPTFGEGHVIRLLGYRRPATPTADTDTIEANANYVMTEAIVYLLTGMVGGPGVDPDDYARQVAIWQRKAEMQRQAHHVRARILPNTVWITETWR